MTPDGPRAGARAGAPACAPIAAGRITGREAPSDALPGTLPDLLPHALRPDWQAPAGITALMSTRQGGVSAAPFDSLNLSFGVGDDAMAVAENRRRNGVGFEYELLDTGIFDDDRYFDIFIEYAKVNEEELVIRIEAFNRGPDAELQRLLAL